MSRSIAKLVSPGDMLISGQTLGEPVALLSELFEGLTGVPDLRLLIGMSLGDTLSRAPSNVELMSFVGLGSNAALIEQERMKLLPCHMSSLPSLFTSGDLRTDVALILVSPPDSSGYCSLGVTSDYVWSAIESARVVLAEVNSNVPRVDGDTAIAFDRLDEVVYSNRPLPEYARVNPSATEQAIADRVAPFIHDGACLQIGVGKLGEAILQAVSDRHDLGIHAGMVGDTILEMARDGVITNLMKPKGMRMTVAGSILGSQMGLHLAAYNRNLRLRSVEHTHDRSVIAMLPNFMCINSAIEIDLLGQVNSEVASGRYLGGIGGAVDFLRGAAAACGGRSIVALPSTAGRGALSRIVPQVERVTALRSDVDIVVTEHGSVELAGLSEGERARRLINLAAPQHRPDLVTAAKAMGI
jgi:acyl-CoA hydrolase